MSTILCVCVHNKLALYHINTGTDKTYIPLHKVNNQVVSGRTSFLRNKFNLVVDAENKNFQKYAGSLTLKSIPLNPDI